MKTHNKLHELIRSLSKTEKTYFKKYASIHSRGGEKNYILLFDALVAQKEYDEEKLKKTLKRSPVMKYFSASQRYLYTSILRSLRLYHNNESNATRSLGLLQDAHFLGNKGLFEQSYAVLQQAKETAVASENMPALLHVYDRLYKGYFQRPDPEKCRAWEKQLYPTILALTDKIKELAEIENLVVANLNLYLKYGDSLSDKDVMRQYKKLLNSPLLRSERTYQSKEAEYRALTLKTVIYAALADYTALYATVQFHQERMEADPLAGKGDLQKRSYVKVLCNKMIACEELGKTEELEETFRKLQSIKPANEAQEIEIFSYSYVNMTGAYVSHGMAEKGIKLVPAILKKLKHFAGSLSAETLYNLQANITALYFIAGDYHRALQWINWKNVPKDIRLDTNIAVRTLSVFVHYELGNLQLAESLLYSLRRLLIKQKEFDDFHKIVFRHMKKLMFIMDPSEMKQELLLFKHELDGLGQRKRWNNASIYYWLEKKSNK